MVRINEYFQVLKSMSQLITEWNEKLNGWFGKNGDNAAFGTLALFVLVAIGFYLVGMFAKK